MTKFYWGNSVSSMQTEGGWNEGGKSLSVYDIREASEFESDWHFANDNYHTYTEDFDLMKAAGMNMYRFQISWSRVVVDGDGDFNQEGIDYYHRFIDDLISRGIEPMICLYHFDMPLHLAETYNGFTSKHVLDAFVRYAKKMVDEFSDKVKWWLTFNEQNLYHQPAIAFKIAGSEETNNVHELYQILHHVMVAHARTANYIHEKSDAKIGGMHAYAEVYPATCKPEDILAARKWDEFVNYTLLDAYTKGHYSHEMLTYIKNNKINWTATDEELADIATQKNDFLSFSYYPSSTISAETIPSDVAPNYYMDYGKKENPYIDKTEWDWQIDPLGFRDVINKMYQRYQLPIFPIENGIGVQEEWDGEHQIQDDYRIDYHKQHLQEMFNARDINGFEILGYLGWGLIDILSSQGDMRKRYGLVYVNRTNHDLRDMKRVPKKSFALFKKVTETDGKSVWY
ncbi:glycoside hydrolase family 1 protein [Lactococcus raffinolactis]|uniref:glycoside hydrolase family 1 protein n=1 Tax=Pseudolactococcus raffinolactis TaxID=1366 RepID=UPI0028A250B2|nr:glycoside hydrolase family 1 protein [Lactococcus raffinolactis]